MLGRRRCDNESVAQTIIALHDRFPPRGRRASYHPRQYLLGFRTSAKLNASSVRGAVANVVDGYYLGEEAARAVNSERNCVDRQQVK